MKLNFSFKNRALVFYIKLAIGLLILLSTVVFFIMHNSVAKGHISFPDRAYITFIFGLVSSIVMLFASFSEIGFLPLISAILMGAVVGQHLFMCCYPYADLATGVPFFVDSGALLTTVSEIYTCFLIVFILLMVASIIICFIDKKSEETLKPAEEAN